MKSKKVKKNEKVQEAELVEKDKKTKKEKKEKEKVKGKEKEVKNNAPKAKEYKKTKEDGFFKNVIKEMKKVKWPDKKYMVKYSIATFATIILSSLYFYLIFVLFSLVKGLR